MRVFSYEGNNMEAFAELLEVALDRDGQFLATETEDGRSLLLAYRVPKCLRSVDVAASIKRVLDELKTTESEPENQGDLFEGR